MKASSLSLLLCVFIAGVLFGIWLDWSTPRHQDFAFLVEGYGANLQVRPGDQIRLVDGTGSGKWVTNFVGNVPCTEGNDVNPCVLQPNLGKGSYYFTCSPAEGGPNGCPDPGIQPQPTTGSREGSGFWKTVAMDFRLSGDQYATIPITKGRKGDMARSAANVQRAIVSCSADKSQTIVQGQNGGDLSAILASKGDVVYWTSSDPFTLTTTSYPDGFCSDKNPGGSNMLVAQCEINQNSATMKYTLHAQNCSNPVSATVTSR